MPLYTTRSGDLVLGRQQRRRSPQATAARGRPTYRSRLATRKFAGLTPDIDAEPINDVPTAVETGADELPTSVLPTTTPGLLAGEAGGPDVAGPGEPGRGIGPSPAADWAGFVGGLHGAAVPGLAERAGTTMGLYGMAQVAPSLAVNLAAMPISNIVGGIRGGLRGAKKGKAAVARAGTSTTVSPSYTGKKGFSRIGSILGSMFGLIDPLDIPEEAALDPTVTGGIPGEDRGLTGGIPPGVDLSSTAYGAEMAESIGTSQGWGGDVDAMGRNTPESGDLGRGGDLSGPMGGNFGFGGGFGGDPGEPGFGGGTGRGAIGGNFGFGGDFGGGGGPGDAGGGGEFGGGLGGETF